MSTIGKFACDYLGKKLSLAVLQSRAGYYIGTASNEDGPVSRESLEYFKTKVLAEQALATGTWTQRNELY